MSAISNDWLEPLTPEFKKPYYKSLYENVKREYHEHEVYPPSDDIFNAFDFTPLNEVKVVIIGQDPYHSLSCPFLQITIVRNIASQILM
jgi:uracil-DNA glycosylase